MAFAVPEALSRIAECALVVAGDGDVGGRTEWGAPHRAEPLGPKEVSYGESTEERWGAGERERRFPGSSHVHPCCDPLSLSCGVSVGKSQVPDTVTGCSVTAYTFLKLPMV